MVGARGIMGSSGSLSCGAREVRFLCSWLGGARHCSRVMVGVGCSGWKPGCGYTSSDAQDNHSQQRIVWFQMSTALWVRKPALHASYRYHPAMGTLSECPQAGCGPRLLHSHSPGVSPLHSKCLTSTCTTSPGTGLPRNTAARPHHEYREGARSDSE